MGTIQWRPHLLLRASQKILHQTRTSGSFWPPHEGICSNSGDFTHFMILWEVSSFFSKAYERIIRKSGSWIHNFDGVTGSRVGFFFFSLIYLFPRIQLTFWIPSWLWQRLEYGCRIHAKWKTQESSDLACEKPGSQLPWGAHNFTFNGIQGRGCCDKCLYSMAYKPTKHVDGNLDKLIAETTWGPLSSFCWVTPWITKASSDLKILRREHWESSRRFVCTTVVVRTVIHFLWRNIVPWAPFSIHWQYLGNCLTILATIVLKRINANLKRLPWNHPTFFLVTKMEKICVDLLY